MSDTSPPSQLSMSLEDWVDLGEEKVLGESGTDIDFFSSVFLAGVSSPPKASTLSPPPRPSRLSSSSSSSSSLSPLSSSHILKSTRISTSFSPSLGPALSRDDSDPYFPLPLPSSDKLEKNLRSLKTELKEYEEELTFISLDKSKSVGGLVREKIWEDHFGNPLSSLPSIDSSFAFIRKRIDQQQKSSPNLQYRTVSSPSIDQNRLPPPSNAPSFTGPLEGLFTEEQRNSLLFYFVPGIYSGHVPGSTDSPDIFKVWFQQIQSTFNLDCRYPTDYPVDGSCLENATFLRNEAERLYQLYGKKLVFVGYSKGSADVFSFVSIHQDSHLVRECIHGVISVCGAFGGSPLASVMTTDHLYIRGIVQLIIENTMGCDFKALLDVTLSERDAFFDSHKLPSPLPFPVISTVGIISGCTYDGFYPLYKFIKKIHGIQSDGVVSEADQCIPGSMRITVPGMNHTVSISDPVPFWGALFWCILNCKSETHDDRSGWLSVGVHAARYCYEEGEGEEEGEEGKYYYLFGSRIGAHEKEHNGFLFSCDASYSPSSSSSPLARDPPEDPVPFDPSFRKRKIEGDFFVKITKTNAPSLSLTTSLTRPTTKPSTTLSNESPTPLPSSPLSTPSCPSSPSPSPSSPLPPKREKCATWDETLSFPSTISSLTNTDELLVELLVDDGDPSSSMVLLMREHVNVGKMVNWEEREKELVVGVEGEVSVSLRLKLCEEKFGDGEIPISL